MKLDELFAHGDTGHLRVLGRVLVNLSSCVVLNRFQALESVASLESRARELMQQNDFLASEYSVKTHAHAGPAPVACRVCIRL